MAGIGKTRDQRDAQPLFGAGKFISCAGIAACPHPCRFKHGNRFGRVAGLGKGIRRDPGQPQVGGSIDRSDPGGFGCKPTLTRPPKRKDGKFHKARRPGPCLPRRKGKPSSRADLPGLQTGLQCPGNRGRVLWRDGNQIVRSRDCGRPVATPCRLSGQVDQWDLTFRSC